MSQTVWDIGDPEPEGVTVVEDYTASEYNSASDFDENPRWGRTSDGSWKGYKANSKIYLHWPDLLRRWGPLREANK